MVHLKKILAGSEDDEDDIIIVEAENKPEVSGQCDPRTETYYP